MTAGVLENLALLSGSPGGLGTLRQLIRDLGVNVRRPEDLMPRYLASLEALES